MESVAVAQNGLFDTASDRGCEAQPYRLRPFQAEFDELCKKLASRSSSARNILAYITPGGGKSFLPVIAAARLIPSVADAICWIAPRTNLADQGHREFYNSDMRKLLGHSHEVQVATNMPDPTDNGALAGYVTTTHAIISDKAKVNLAEFKRRRYILVLDEVHHIWQGGDWERAIRPLVEEAEVRIFMTGSLTRHDRKQISFLPYVDTGDGGKIVDMSQKTAGWEKIYYGSKDAIEDKAIIRVQFNFSDARAEWTDRNGQRKSVCSFNEAGDELSDAIYTALRTDYATNLLDRSVDHWKGWRECNSRAKLLVVAPDVVQARDYLSHLKDCHGLSAEIATSEEKYASEVIRRFRENKFDVLVTVQMAYEGLNNPAITHIACLTHIRSYPWIEQMVARATRYDREAGEWEGQWAFVFAPDDPEMRDILKKIREEQIEATRNIFSREGVERDGDGRLLPSITPHASELHTERIADLSGNFIPPEDAAWIAQHKSSLGVAASEMDIAKIISRFRETSAPLQASSPRSVFRRPEDSTSPAVTVTDRKRRDRQEINDKCAKINRLRAARMGVPFKETDWKWAGQRLRSLLGKEMKNYTEEDCQKAWQYLRQIEMEMM